MRSNMLAFVVGLAVTAGCGSSSSSYANIEVCIKANDGDGNVGNAIAKCIEDDTIDGSKLSFATQGDCELYVDENSEESADDIDNGCAEYIAEK